MLDFLIGVARHKAIVREDVAFFKLKSVSSLSITAVGVKQQCSTRILQYHSYVAGKGLVIMDYTMCVTNDNQRLVNENNI